MSITAVILHYQPHEFIYGAVNSLLSQSVKIDKFLVLNSTSKTINKELPSGNFQIVGKEPSDNYFADLGMVLPHINTEFILMADSKNLFYKNMAAKMLNRLDAYPTIAACYSDFDLFSVKHNQSIRGFMPSYDARLVANNFKIPITSLYRVPLLKQLPKVTQFIDMAQKYLFTHVPEALYMERTFE